MVVGGKYARLVEQLLPDPLHVGVGLDHLGVVVGRSGERDPVLGAQSAGGDGGRQRLLVAVQMG